MAVTVTPDGVRTVEVVRDRPNVSVVKQDTAVNVASGGLQGPRGADGQQGQPGPAGDGTLTKLAATALGGHRIVRATSATTAGYASASNAAHADDVLGMTFGAAAEGDEVSIIAAAEITEPSWNWTPLSPLWIGENGQPTQIPPDAGDGAAFSLVVGFALTATTVRIRIEQPIYF